ncbi:unnamed protein product [Cunninghamella echinulata]
MSDESRENLLSNAAAIETDLESGQARSTLNESSTNNFNNSNAVRDYFEQSSHPIAAFFFLAFRLGALLMYLLGSIFTDNFTLVFVITILLLAFDFWTVKNISGRLLVGLRWWNEIQEMVQINGYLKVQILIDKLIQQIHAYFGQYFMEHQFFGYCLHCLVFSQLK